MGIGEAELGYDAIDEGSLGKGDGACSAVAFNADADVEVGWATIGDLPTGLELGFEMGKSMFGVCKHEKIVDVNSDDDGTVGIMTVVDTIFTFEAEEMPVDELSMKGLIPNAASLFQGRGRH